MSGLWPIVLRSLWGRRWRTGFTAAAVALGIAIILGVQTALAGLDVQAHTAQVDRAGKSGLDVRISSGNGLDATQFAALKNTPGILAAVPLFEKRVVARANDQDVDGVTVTMVSVSADGTSALRPVTLTSGRIPYPNSHSDVAIDAGLAEALGKRGNTTVQTGSSIQLTTNTGPDIYKVVGITSGTSGGAAFTRSAVFASESAMTTTFSLGLHAPLVALELNHDADATTVAAAVRQTLGSGITIVDPRNGGAAPLDQLRPLLLLLMALSIFVGAGVTANSVSLAAIERRRDVALLRAGGASATQVTRAFLAEAVMTALIGVPFGLIAGVGLGMLMTHAITSDSVPAHVEVGTALIAAGIGVCAGILGAAIPAVLAGRSPILDGLRPHSVDKRDRVSRRLLLLVPVATVLAVVCFLSGDSSAVAVGGALVLLAVIAALPALATPLIRGIGVVARVFSSEASVATANLTRRRNRTALTIAGLAVSVATAVATAALAGGASGASDAWIRQLFVGDAVIKSPVTQSDAIATAIAHSPGVRTVSELRLLGAPVGGDVVGVAIVDPAAYTNSGGLDVITPGHDEAIRHLTTDASILVPQSMSDATGWRVGTILSIDTGHGKTGVRVAGIITHSFPAGDGRESILMSRNLGVTLFGPAAGGFDDLMVTTVDGDMAALGTTASSYGLSSVSVVSIQASARQALSHSIGLLEAIAAISVLIAMLAVANTLAVNVRQGTRELALLRAVGLSRRRALRLVLVEAALMGTAGTIVGLVAGGLLALPMIAASSTPGFVPMYLYPGPTAVFVVAAVMVATCVAAAVPARRAVTASIVGAIRYE